MESVIPGSDRQRFNNCVNVTAQFYLSGLQLQERMFQDYRLLRFVCTFCVTDVQIDCILHNVNLFTKVRGVEAWTWIERITSM
jgi:hypothetical protein